MLLPLHSIATATRAEAADESSYVKELAVLINQYRERSQLKALGIDSKLSVLAREHSAAMAKANRLNHDGMPSRVQKSGWAMCVENVGWNYPTAQAQFNGWRESKGHDSNLLDPRVEKMGIGVVSGYVTQIACGK